MKNKLKQKAAGCVVLLVCMVFLLAACSAQAPTEGKEIDLATPLTTEQKLEDVTVLCEQLEKRHKNMYASISREQFQALRTELEQQLPNLDNVGFFYELRRLAASVGDAHTNVGLHAPLYDIARGLSFAVLPVSDGWRIAMIDQEHQDYLGWRLTAINQTPIEEVYEKAAAIISHDNDAWLERQFSNTINYMGALRAIGVADNLDSATLTVADDSGRQEQITLKGLSTDEIMSQQIMSLSRAEVATGYRSDLAYHLLPLEDQALFIQYNACQEREDLSIKDFATQITQQLDATPFPKVIVDLRYNTGGDSRVFQPVIRLLKEKMAAQGFSLYVLIGGDTFSSGLLNALDLKEIGGMLVGRPTGGSVNAYGELKSFELPNLPVSVWYSTKYFEQQRGYEGDSLLPDMQVEYTMEDITGGNDPDVNAVLALQ